MKIQQIFSQRLRNARIRKCLSYKDFAKAINNIVSAQTLRNYETGVSFPNSNVMGEILRVLDVKIDMLFKPFSVDWEHVKFNYRKQKSVTATVEKSIMHTIRDSAEKYIEIDGIIGDGQHPTEIIKACRGNVVHTVEDARAIAQCFRSKARILDEPIVSIQDVIESIGIKLIPIRTEAKFDGVNFEVDGHIFICYNDQRQNCERTRFTLAHELGHLLLNMPEDVEEEKVEKFCNTFASELLLPQARLMSILGSNRHNISINELKYIQSLYGISVNAILFAAKEHNIITENRYKTYHIKKNSNNKIASIVDESVYVENWHNRYSAMVYRALSSELISSSKAAFLLNKDIQEVNNNINLV